jgi:hypothetical protein
MATDGVVISQETIASSEQKKRAHRTLRQMPIYRDMANLKYFVVCLYDKVPRKYTRYIDGILMTVSEAKKYFYVEGHYESIHMKNEYKLNF